MKGANVPKVTKEEQRQAKAALAQLSTFHYPRYDQLPQEHWDEYRLIDAPAWDAKEVYQLYHSREPVNQFLVCWPGRMAEVNFDSGWTITEDMMSTAAEALKNA